MTHAAANVLDVQWCGGVQADRHAEIVPVVDGFAVDRHDAIANLQSRARRRLARADLADHRLHDQRFSTRHADDRDEHQRDQQIHERSRKEDQESLPLWLRKEFIRIAGPIVFGRVSGHANVSAEWNERNAVVGVAFSKAEQPFPKADCELLHAHTQQLGDGIVAKFMD